MSALRIGVLGAARITPMALLTPARDVARDLGANVVVVAAIAARDRRRAARFAARHGIAAVYDDYDALIHSDVDAVYNPLPNSHHHAWTIKALNAGKHVLVEKPMAQNAAEATAMRDAADTNGRVLMEAFHWRHHPLADAVLDEVKGIWPLRSVRASFIVPFFLPGDIRYRHDLGGGAIMDTGCYATHIVRTFAGLAGLDADIVVDDADVRLTKKRGGVDRWCRFDFHTTKNPEVHLQVEAGLCTGKIFSCRAVITGEGGTVDVWNPVAPQFGHRLRVHRDGRLRGRVVSGHSTYRHQLEAFVAAVNEGAPVVTDAKDGIRTMAAIDAFRSAAGLAAFVTVDA